MKTAYPTASDLLTFLTDAEIATDTATALATSTVISAAIQDVEQSCNRIFLAPADAETRYYDPPTGPTGKLFIADLASFTSLSYQPEGSTATTLTRNEDFWLLPDNAATLSQPYTCIEFRRRWPVPLPATLRRSLLLVGKHGYGTRGDSAPAVGGFPEAVWDAMLARAGERLWPRLRQALTGGMLSFTELGVTESFGVEPWRDLKDGWTSTVRSTVAQYRRRGV